MESGAQSLSRTESRIANWFDRYRLPIALFVIVYSVFAAIGLTKPEAPRSFESRLDQEAFALLESTHADFTVTESSLFLVLESDDLFSRDSLDAQHRLLEAVRGKEGITDVIALDRIPVIKGLSVSFPLLPAADASDEAIEAARRMARSHTLVADQLISQNEKILVLPVRVHPNYASNDTGVEVDELVRGLEFPPSTRVRVTGLFPIVAESERVFARERYFFMAVGFLLAAGFAVALFKSASAVLIAGIAPNIGVLWTLGTLRWMGEARHDMTSIVLPILLMMIGFTDGIHLIVHARKARRAGRNAREASKESLANLGAACMWTSVTTAIGFGSLAIAGSTYASEFGRACAIGVVLTFLAVVTSIPLLIGTPLGNRIHKGWKVDPIDYLVEKLERIVDFVLRRSRTVTVLGLLATVAMLVIALQLRPNTRFTINMPDGSEPYAVLKDLDEHHGGIQFGRVILSWPEDAEEERILAAIAAVEGIIDGEPLFRGSFSIRDFLAIFPGETQTLDASQLLPEAATSGILNRDERKALVTMRVRDKGYRYYGPLYERVDLELAQLEEEFPGFEFNLTGDPVFYGRNLARVVVDLVGSLGLAAGLILAVLWMVFRSWRIGLLSVFPNVFPLAVTASLLYWVEDGGLELASVCSFTICLGIAVDDTIHFLTRFQRERKRTDDLELAIHRSVRGVGAALVTTTIVLVVGFGVVLTSEIPVNRLFAGMGCTTIAAALLGDLVLLPAMLKVVLGSQKS